MKISALKKSGKKGDPYYERDFLKSETKEVRLYGLDGDDVFQITGINENGVLIRTIGGHGNDDGDLRLPDS